MVTNLRLRNNQRTGIQRPERRISARYSHYQQEWKSVRAISRGSDDRSSRIGGRVETNGEGGGKCWDVSLMI
ncbi:hypothetical protein SAMN05216428_102347 [Nitrosospira sp. Nsp11]|nr:hypothetical protein SAMN05216428_102347 [Nitrosospira sp. Nsp11]